MYYISLHKLAYQKECKYTIILCKKENNGTASSANEDGCHFDILNRGKQTGMKIPNVQICNMVSYTLNITIAH